MTDYSQSGEQKYILKALGVYEGQPAYTKPPRLLDIGAWNAKTFSNSRALIELGWSAVLFEPSPGPLRGLVEEYGNNSRVEVVGLPVSIAGGFMELRVTDDALSADAGNVEHLKKWEGYGFYGTMTTRAVSLLDLYRAWDGTTFDFVSIDTEGTSVDLFAQMIRDYWRPRCVCVEHEERWEELRKAAEAGNYRLVSPPEGSINAILEHVK
jgi:FkbM family methyltransferase